MATSLEEKQTSQGTRWTGDKDEASRGEKPICYSELSTICLTYRQTATLGSVKTQKSENKIYNPTYLS